MEDSYRKCIQTQGLGKTSGSSQNQEPQVNRRSLEQYPPREHLDHIQHLHCNDLKEKAIQAKTVAQKLSYFNLYFQALANDSDLSEDSIFKAFQDFSEIDDIKTPHIGQRHFYPLIKKETNEQTNSLQIKAAIISDFIRLVIKNNKQHLILSILKAVVSFENKTADKILPANHDLVVLKESIRATGLNSEEIKDQLDTFISTEIKDPKALLGRELYFKMAIQRGQQPTLRS